MMLRKVQYGCGLSAPEAWINYDSSMTLKLQKLPLIGKLVPSGPFGRFPSNIRIGDIVKGLPEAPASVDLVSCSHVLEHLTLDEFRLALRNTLVMMKPGATFRFVLPDLEAKAKSYIASRDTDASHHFMENTYLGKASKDRSLKGFIRDYFRNDQHMWMWDYKSMREELQKSGFINIRRAYFGDSDFRDFDEIEEESRWNHELGVECQKPK